MFSVTSVNNNSYEIYEIETADYHYGSNSHMFTFSSGEVAASIRTTAIADNKWLYISEFDTAATDAELSGEITDAIQADALGTSGLQRDGYGNGGIVHFYAIDPNDWVLNVHQLIIPDTHVSWFRHPHANGPITRSLDGLPESSPGDRTRKLILEGQIPIVR